MIYGKNWLALGLLFLISTVSAHADVIASVITLGPGAAPPIIDMVTVQNTPITLCNPNGDCQILGGYQAYYASSGSTPKYLPSPSGTATTPLDVQSILSPNPPGATDYGYITEPYFLSYNLGNNLSGTYLVQLTANRVLAPSEEIHLAVLLQPNGFLIPNQTLYSGSITTETVFQAMPGITTLFVHGFGNGLVYHVTVSQVPLPSAAWMFLGGFIGLLGLKRRKSW